MQCNTISSNTVFAYTTRGLSLCILAVGACAELLLVFQRLALYLRASQSEHSDQGRLALKRRRAHLDLIQLEHSSSLSELESAMDTTKLMWRLGSAGVGGCAGWI